MINLVYPELQFSSAGLERLSEGERLEPISHLGLTARTQNVLIWRKAETLGQLVDVLRSERGIGIVRNFGRKSHEELVHAVLALSEAVDSGGAVDWKKYAKLARKEFVGMRVSEAARFVGLLQAPDSTPKRNDWPRPFGKIPEEVASQPLQSLPFSNRAFQGLKSMGATTIGEATRICPTDLLKLRNVGRNTINEIYQTILAAVAPQTEDSIVRDDPAFASSQFPLVPKRLNGLSDQFYADFFTELPAVIQKTDGKEEAEILKSRLFRPLGKGKTLNAIGKKFGVTRERIRQKEDELMRKINAALFHSRYTFAKTKKNSSDKERYGKVNFKIHPKLQKNCEGIPEKMENETPFIIKKSDWVSRLARRLGVSPDLIDDKLTFWITALKVKDYYVNSKKGFSNDTLLFKSSESIEKVKEVCKAVSDFNDIILSSPLGISREEIILKLKKACKKYFNDEAKITCLQKLSSVLIHKDSSKIIPHYVKPIKLNRNDLEKIITSILNDSGGHIKQNLLLYKMQEKFPLIKNINKAVISDIISKSSKVSSIGKTGYCKMVKNEL